MRPLKLPRSPKGAPRVGDPTLAIIPAVATIARLRSPAGVAHYLTHEVPEKFYPAIRSHIAGRPAVFAPAIYRAALAFLDATPAERERMAIFTLPPVVVRPSA